MALSEAKKRANKKWNKANYRQVYLSMPIAEADRLAEYCNRKGISKAGFIRRLIKEAIDADGGGNGSDDIL